MNTLKVMVTTFALLYGFAMLVQRKRVAADFKRRNGKEISRYENAEKHLSNFDRELTKDHFDKGKLDNAIDDVKNVVEHNTLDPQSRDALRRDLGDLRILRDERR